MLIEQRNYIAGIVEGILLLFYIENANRAEELYSGYCRRDIIIVLKG